MLPTTHILVLTVSKIVEIFYITDKLLVSHGTVVMILANTGEEDVSQAQH